MSLLMGLLLPAVQIYFCPSRRTASIAQDSISGDQMWLGGIAMARSFPAFWAVTSSLGAV
jgi:hypothetical protein